MRNRYVVMWQKADVALTNYIVTENHHNLILIK